LFRGREYGPRTYANLGAAQHWNLAQHWGFDFAVDRSQTLSGAGVPAFDPDVPVYSGAETDDYTAISLGAGYSRDNVAFTTRVETRMGELEDQWNFTLGALRERDRTSYAGHIELLTSERGGALPAREDLYGARFSLAYRPLERAGSCSGKSSTGTAVSGGGLDIRRPRAGSLSSTGRATAHGSRSVLGEVVAGTSTARTSRSGSVGVEARHDVAGLGRRLSRPHAPAPLAQGSDGGASQSA
jgi:hypothetical protein